MGFPLVTQLIKRRKSIANNDFDKNNNYINAKYHLMDSNVVQFNVLMCLARIVGIFNSNKHSYFMTLKLYSALHLSYRNANMNLH